MSEDKVVAFVDVTDVVCPVTFVKVEVALEEIADGQLLEIKLNDGEAIKNIPRSLKDDGHLVTSVERRDDQTFQVIVKKGGLR
ncbi:MAG TPA: sulfurtransferase TusA family protein [Negativicutes bacterium]|nr:sulfurtransferase TusA family protein [Negativicutes bacterium]